MMGENGVAAYSVLLYYAYIFVAVFLGCNLTVTPLIGYNYGTGDKAELRSLLKHSLILLLVLGFLMTLVSELTAAPAARLFVGYDPELTKLTSHAIRLYMLSFFIAGINLFTSSWFTGLGNGEVSAVVSFIRNLILELGFVFLLPSAVAEQSVAATLSCGYRMVDTAPYANEAACGKAQLPVQIILCWHMQMGFVTIPGSSNADHIHSNFAHRECPCKAKSRFAEC